MAQDDYQSHQVSIKDLIFLTIITGGYLYKTLGLLRWWSMATVVGCFLGNPWVAMADILVFIHCVFFIVAIPCFQNWDHILYFFYQWCCHGFLLLIDKKCHKIPGIYCLFWSFLPFALGIFFSLNNY
jgi:hypothetical protein